MKVSLIGCGFLKRDIVPNLLRYRTKPKRMFYCFKARRMKTMIILSNVSICEHRGSRKNMMKINPREKIKCVG